MCVCETCGCPKCIAGRIVSRQSSSCFWTYDDQIALTERKPESVQVMSRPGGPIPSSLLSQAVVCFYIVHSTLWFLAPHPPQDLIKIPGEANRQLASRRCHRCRNLTESGTRGRHRCRGALHESSAIGTVG